MQVCPRVCVCSSCDKQRRYSSMWSISGTNWAAHEFNSLLRRLLPRIFASSSSELVGTCITHHISQLRLSVCSHCCSPCQLICICHYRSTSFKSASSASASELHDFQQPLRRLFKTKPMIILKHIDFK